MSAATTIVNPSSSASAPSKNGKLVKLVALAVVVLLIVGECLATFVFLSHSEGAATESPEADQVAGHAAVASQAAHGHDTPASAGHGHPTADAAHGSASAVAAHDHSPMAEREVDLGQYALTSHQPATNRTLLVDFHLYAIVASEDEAAFRQRFEQNKHRFREQVIVTMRGAETADFADPGLGLIKRLILEKSNAVLGKPLLRSVIFSEFTFLEQ
jgi:hypothetical protein